MKEARADMQRFAGRFAGAAEVGAVLGALVGLVEGMRAQGANLDPSGSGLTAVFLSVLLGAITGGLGAPAVVVLIASPGSLREAGLPPGAGRGIRAFSDLVVLVLFLSVVGFWSYYVLAVLTPDTDRFVRGGAAAIAAGALGLAGRARLRHTDRRAQRAAVGVVVVLALLVSWAVVVLRSERIPTSLDCGNGLAIVPPSASAATRPNVLFVVLDTARRDRMSLYGYPLETTPFLETFARESTVYLNAISPAPWTLPSHASMFTGLMPSSHRATSEHRYLDSGTTTLAEILQRAGYDTAGFSCNSVVGSLHNLQRGFRTFLELDHQTWSGPEDPVENLYVVRVARKVTGRRLWKDKGAEAANRCAALWLDERQRQGRTAPFFVFVNYLETHLPYLAPESDRRRFVHGPLRPAVRRLVSDSFTHGAIYRMIGQHRSLAREDYQQIGEHYDAAMAYADRELESLIGEFERRGLLENTLVVVVSDHGENLGDHEGLLGHAFSVHQSLIRVPLLVRYPGRAAAGRRLPQLVSIVGLFPTILRAAGIPLSPDAPPAVGPLPVTEADPGLTGAIAEYDVPVFELYNLAIEARGFDIGPLIVRQRTIQTGDWKLIVPSEGEPKLYRLDSDPDELRPLRIGDAPEGEELLRTLETEVARFRRTHDPSGTIEEGIDDETRKALKSLGYL